MRQPARSTNRAYFTMLWVDEMAWQFVPAPITVGH